MLVMSAYVKYQLKYPQKASKFSLYLWSVIYFLQLQQDDGLSDAQQGGQFKAFGSDLVARYPFQGRQLVVATCPTRPQDDILPMRFSKLFALSICSVVGSLE